MRKFIFSKLTSLQDATLLKIAFFIRYFFKQFDLMAASEDNYFMRKLLNSCFSRQL